MCIQIGDDVYSNCEWCRVDMDRVEKLCKYKTGQTCFEHECDMSLKCFFDVNSNTFELKQLGLLEHCLNCYSKYYCVFAQFHKQ